MFTYSRKYFMLLVLVWAGHSVLWAQSVETRQHKAEVDSLVERMAQVHADQVLMSKRADSLAQAITRLKQRAKTPLNDGALETAYRTSQIMAESLQKTQAEAQYIDQLLRQKAERLLKNLNDDLARLALETKAAKARREQERYEQLARELQVCRQWQKHCQEILASPPTTILIYEVRVLPEDDAATLSRKADFLRDQADRLERESKRVTQKLAELNEEAKLRTRMTEFVGDLALFEPSNEGVRGGEQTTPAFQSSIDRNEMSANAVQQAAFSPSELMIPLIWPDKVSALSLQDLYDWQKRLRRAQTRLRAQADSLKQRASEIEAMSRMPHE